MHGVILGIALGVVLTLMYFMVIEPFVAGGDPLGKVVTLHYAPWCGYCKEFKPKWEFIKKSMAGTGVSFREINEDEAKTPGLGGVPAIVLYDSDGFRYKYEGPREVYNIKQWILAPKKQQSAPSSI